MKCLYNGDRVFGYGVDPDTRKYVIDEREAAYVREAFARRLDGEAANAIAADFRERGVLSVKGNPCGAHMVSNLLRNDRYVGVYRWGSVRVEGGMPAIIDRETFEAVQRAPRARRNVETWRDYPLAGKALCGACGASLQGSSANGHGGRYDYYRCGGSGCGRLRVRADWLEEAIAGAVRGLLGDRSEALRVANEVAAFRTGDDVERRRSELQRSKREAEETLSNLMVAMKRGAWHPSMQDEIDGAEARRDRAVRDLTLLEAEADFDVEDFADFLQWGATLDDATVLDAFVWQVTVDSDVAVATLNYDRAKKEPARVAVDLERVRGAFKWWTSSSLALTPRLLVVAGEVLLVVPRVA